MRKDKENREKSKIDTDDGWNRTFYGSPTIGGLLVVGAIILYIILKVNGRKSTIENVSTIRNGVKVLIIYY